MSIDQKAGAGIVESRLRRRVVSRSGRRPEVSSGLLLTLSQLIYQAMKRGLRSEF